MPKFWGKYVLLKLKRIFYKDSNNVLTIFKII